MFPTFWWRSDHSHKFKIILWSNFKADSQRIIPAITVMEMDLMFYICYDRCFCFGTYYLINADKQTHYYKIYTWGHWMLCFRHLLEKLAKFSYMAFINSQNKMIILCNIPIYIVNTFSQHFPTSSKSAADILFMENSHIQ